MITLYNICFNHIFLIQQTKEKISHTKFPQVSQAPNLTDSPALRRSLFSNIPPTSQCVLIYAIPHVTSYCSGCCFLDLSYFLFIIPNWCILVTSYDHNRSPIFTTCCSFIAISVNFMLHNEMSANQLTDELRKQLKWKLSNITPAIVKRCARWICLTNNTLIVKHSKNELILVRLDFDFLFSNSGFRLMRKTCSDWG